MNNEIEIILDSELLTIGEILKRIEVE